MVAYVKCVLPGPSAGNGGKKMKKITFLLIVTVLAVTVSAACIFAGCSGAKALPDEVTLDDVLEKGGYELVWGDEFEGNEIDYTKWRVGYQGGVRRAGYYVDTPDAVFVKDGALTIRTQYKEDGVYGPGWYTSWVDSAVSDTVGSSIAHSDDYVGFAGKYGYYEVRCITPPTVGIWSAFWMMPDGNAAGMSSGDLIGTGRDGLEVDVMESPYMYQNGSWNVHVVHGEGYSNTRTDRSDTYEVPGMYSQYHTYGVLWTEDEYVFYIDGRETWRTSYSPDGETLGVSQVEEYLLLTVEVGGYQAEDGTLRPGVTPENGEEVPYWCGNPDDNDKTKAYDFIIDYVRVYQARSAGRSTP